ncbi:MAG: UDP-N-acetylmuramate dehydrogenase [Chloroflexota bacterium]|nr:UDP-N-acetylmuramate dehydrogenase [Dehalococcoidia bacterium]MDW8046095.1 UDP-N-acetylmuramate dehydrogenase [Chloroflexota bacterium]
MSALRALARAFEAYGDVRLGEPLARHTTFGIGGPADLFVTVRSAEALAGAMAAAAAAGLPVFVLGSGSNILVSDRGIRGVVIDNRARRERAVEEYRYRLESGVPFAAFARRACRLGAAGLAWAVGIPGTLGGAVVYNAGAYGGCLADVLSAVRIFAPGEGEDWVPAERLGLVYRGSVFTRGIFAGKAVLEVELALAPGDPRELAALAAEYDRRRLAAQPRGRNAGSMFKNPPEAPAWKLIDAVGLRGARRGDAAISEQHCNFFVNLGQATASDVAWLVAEAERRVFEQFGIRLEREVAFVGEWG